MCLILTLQGSQNTLIFDFRVTCLVFIFLTFHFNSHVLYVITIGNISKILHDYLNNLKLEAIFLTGIKQYMWIKMKLEKHKYQKCDPVVKYLSILGHPVLLELDPSPPGTRTKRKKLNLRMKSFSVDTAELPPALSPTNDTFNEGTKKKSTSFTSASSCFGG